jgi:hypothetical protein
MAAGPEAGRRSPDAHDRGAIGITQAHDYAAGVIPLDERRTDVVGAPGSTRFAASASYESCREPRAANPRTRDPVAFERILRRL